MATVTSVSLRSLKQSGEKIAALTAYDYPTAKLLDASGVEVILVGDSLGMVLMGRDNTLGVTMDEMVHHVRMVSPAVENALLVADMPFLSYHASRDEAVRNAGRFVAEGGAHAVKVEGAPQGIRKAIRGILRAGIPVMGHLGLTPQSIREFGGFKVQGKNRQARERIAEAAKELEDLGCFSVVLECIPADLAAEITHSLSIPTIGIGAGAGCDGQILVMHDILGWGHTRFAKTFADVKGLMEEGFKSYLREVKAGTFPAVEHTYQCKS